MRKPRLKISRKPRKLPEFLAFRVGVIEPGDEYGDRHQVGAYGRIKTGAGEIHCSTPEAGGGCGS